MIPLFLSVLCAHPTLSSIHQTSFLAFIVSRKSFDSFERNKAAAIYPVCLITQPSYSHNFPKTKTAINNRELLYFGARNKDKNGEVIIPMTVKIIKKELNIPKEDSCFGVDMEVEEK